MQTGHPEPSPWLDIVSHGRWARQGELRLSSTQIELIDRTVRRVPEVMVKVSGGGKNASAVAAHLAYIDRHGDLPIDTDEGERRTGSELHRDLVREWELDVDSIIAEDFYSGRPGRKGAKLVHNIVLSMPAGTPPSKLLAASKSFAREQFALRHRYAMVLHTDQAHPHVHLVVKAVSEAGIRLNIRKATLRDWRREFSRHLREQGIAANATPCFARGRASQHVRDSAYRARGPGRLPASESRPARARSRSLSDEHFTTVQRSWHGVHRTLVGQGHGELARAVAGFSAQLESLRHQTPRRLDSAEPELDR